MKLTHASAVKTFLGEDPIEKRAALLETKRLLSANAFDREVLNGLLESEQNGHNLACYVKLGMSEALNIFPLSTEEVVDLIKDDGILTRWLEMENPFRLRAWEGTKHIEAYRAGIWAGYHLDKNIDSRVPTLTKKDPDVYYKVLAQVQESLIQIAEVEEGTGEPSLHPESAGLLAMYTNALYEANISEVTKYQEEWQEKTQNDPEYLFEFDHKKKGRSIL